MCCECMEGIDCKKRDRERERKEERRGREEERERERGGGGGGREKEKERERECMGIKKYLLSSSLLNLTWLQSRWRVMIEAATQCLS